MSPDLPEKPGAGIARCTWGKAGEGGGQPPGEHSREKGHVGRAQGQLAGRTAGHTHPCPLNLGERFTSLATGSQPTLPWKRPDPTSVQLTPQSEARVLPARFCHHTCVGGGAHGPLCSAA